MPVSDDRDVEPTTAKYLFGVINYPVLRRDLVCEPFTIRSRKIGADALDAFGPKEDQRSELVTADGEYAIPEPVPPNDSTYQAFAGEAYDVFSRHVEILDLLLSFAHRRHVQAWNPAIYVERDGELHLKGGGGIYPDWEGARRGKPWYIREIDLEAFIQQAYARMVDEYDEVRGGEQRTGLRLALHALNGARGGGTGEVRYLRAWSALEILVNYSNVRQLTVSRSRFDRQFKRPLQDKIDEIAGNDAAAEDMRAKLPDLNRRGIVTRIKEFLAVVLPLQQYPQHQTDEAELAEFRNIRDDITHAGAMQSRRLERAELPPDQYGALIHERQMLLIALIETVVMALLGWQGYPMDVS